MCSSITFCSSAIVACAQRRRRRSAFVVCSLTPIAVAVGRRCISNSNSTHGNSDTGSTRSPLLTLTRGTRAWTRTCVSGAARSRRRRAARCSVIINRTAPIRTTHDNWESCRVAGRGVGGAAASRRFSSRRKFSSPAAPHPPTHVGIRVAVTLSPLPSQPFTSHSLTAACVTARERFRCRKEKSAPRTTRAPQRS